MTEVLPVSYSAKDNILGLNDRAGGIEVIVWRPSWWNLIGRFLHCMKRSVGAVGTNIPSQTRREGNCHYRTT